MIQGLYHKIAVLEARHANACAAMRQIENARDCHLAGAHAKEVARDITRWREMADADELLVLGMQNLLDTMAILPPTAHRVLAIRHIEDAQSRLMRELGDKPVSSTASFQ